MDALYKSGLLRLKLPRVLGGAEADLVTQLDVLEAVSEIEPSAGWCLMIGAASLGGVGAFLPDDAIEEIFTEGKPPKTAGVFAPFGKAVPVEGGYLLSGRWSFASGVRHSDWISAGARVVSEDVGYPPQIRATIRTSDVKIHDNWQVIGLRGTGSCDFSVKDLFVPYRFAYDVSLTEPLRGGAMYRLGRPGFVTNEHSAFALGVGTPGFDRSDRGGSVQGAGLHLGQSLGASACVPAYAQRERPPAAGGQSVERRDTGRGVAGCV